MLCCATFYVPFGHKRANIRPTFERIYSLRKVFRAHFRLSMKNQIDERGFCLLANVCILVLFRDKGDFWANRIFFWLDFSTLGFCLFSFEWFSFVVRLLFYWQNNGCHRIGLILFRFCLWPKLKLVWFCAACKRWDKQRQFERSPKYRINERWSPKDHFHLAKPQLTENYLQINFPFYLIAFIHK